MRTDRPDQHTGASALAEPSETAATGTTAAAAGTVREEDLEPVGRDYRFLFRLVSALVLGVFVALWVGARARTAASSCGAGLLRPGSSVIPAVESQGNAESR